jgi:hypothetical protein
MIEESELAQSTLTSEDLKASEMTYISSIITVAYTATVQNEKDVLRQPASARPLKSDLAPHVPNRDVYPLLIRRHEGIVSVGSNVDPIYR